MLTRAAMTSPRAKLGQERVAIAPHEVKDTDLRPGVAG